ncbi:MAG: class I SAM-dependent methyltransferase [Candidatus Krumholzibacteriota bacterium]|nr:class I SAM-dependent methyltransferase [Candidatus Krumholzibacteriota bacterium]
MERIKSRLRRHLWKAINKEAFEEDFIRILPDTQKDAARFLFYGNATAEEKRIAKLIEANRSQIIATAKELHSFSSPHSGTFKKDAKGHATAGPYTSSPAKAVAMTGVKKKGGILIKRITTGLGARRILELGTHTGFSGCYFLTCPQVEQLVTVEGSKDLCEIADRNLRRISNKFIIMNMLFDDAIDQLSHNREKFDCVFIDGQHEREATWHYMKRVMPLLNDGGSIIFDDIYWSDDMNQLWKEICNSLDFSVTLDLQSKGVAILRSGEEAKVHYDICEYVGRSRIFRKGW